MASRKSFSVATWNGDDNNEQWRTTLGRLPRMCANKEHTMDLENLVHNYGSSPEFKLLLLA